MRKLNKKYVSETDKFLQAFDEQHPIKSESQEKEIYKASEIAKKRDNAALEDDTDELWTEF